MSKMSSLFDAAVFLAQTVAPAGPGAGQPPGGPMDTFKGMLPIILMLGGFWFLFIAPQRKKQKEHDRMLKALQSGDEIVTTGGIYGVITNVKEDRFVVRIADNTKIELGKSFIATVLKQQGATTEKK
ncbi:MAG: preprotein translocase subunit YajC [Opitutaceae bacterium]